MLVNAGPGLSMLV